MRSTREARNDIYTEQGGGQTRARYHLVHPRLQFKKQLGKLSFELGLVQILLKVVSAELGFVNIGSISWCLGQLLLLTENH